MYTFSCILKILGKNILCKLKLGLPFWAFSVKIVDGVIVNKMRQQIMVVIHSALIWLPNEKFIKRLFFVLILKNILESVVAQRHTCLTVSDLSVVASIPTRSEELFVFRYPDNKSKCDVELRHSTCNTSENWLCLLDVMS